jgi:hypothetical protein
MQCATVRQCAAVRAAVFGSACSSVRLSGSACGCVRQLFSSVAVCSCLAVRQFENFQINSKYTSICIDLYKVVTNQTI